MTALDRLNEWVSYELSSNDYATKAAEWLAGFYDPKSHLFHVTFEQFKDWSNDPLEPNAASSLIGLIHEECLTLPWKIESTEFEKLSAKVENMLLHLGSFPEQTLLPLRNLGVLPLFSTSYLAALLPLRMELKDLTRNNAFTVVLRRVLSRVFVATTRTDLSEVDPDPIHPFSLFYITRGLKRLQNRIAAAPTEADALTQRILDENEMARRFQTYNLRDYGEFERKLSFGTPDFDKFVGGHHLSDCIQRTLRALEENCLSVVLNELARASRSATKGPDVDAAGTAFAMRALADINLSRHKTLLIQGLRAVLLSVDRTGFSAGRPFHSDEKGRALFVPSLSIGNSALAVFLLCHQWLSIADRDLAVSVTTMLHDELLENWVSFDRKGKPAVSGWFSDRAPSNARVDSWVTAQALGFFARRLNMMRTIKRRDILLEYGWTPYPPTRPDWDKMQDPDVGHFAIGLKDRLLEAVNNRDGGRAPTFVLYGPPGTAKTTLVQALAVKLGWDLITLSRFHLRQP